MAMLEMLTEMVGAEELLCGVALAELVMIMEMFGTNIPVLSRDRIRSGMAHNRTTTRELFAAIPTHISLARVIEGFMECTLSILEI